MSTNGIIGREYEQKLIRNYYDSNKAELVAIYGRRRVGKTFLVKKMLEGEFSFSFTGMYEASRAVQLNQFQKNLERYSKKAQRRLKDWFDAFDVLREYLESLQKDKIVVFLDELPWMDTPKGNFLNAFGQFWNDWASTKSQLKLFVCGSATTWMMSKLIGNKGGLYGRVCRSIYLAPFSLKETELFLKEVKEIDWSRKQIIEAYMILGGIPFYLDMILKGQPLSASINDLFYREGAPLRYEFDFLFRSLFKESTIYKRIIETLAQKGVGMSRQELLQELKLQEGGNLTEILENLVMCDFIRKYTILGKNSRDIQYQLTDLFSLFHLKFVAHHNGQDEHYWSNLDGKSIQNTWKGIAFERVCLHHIKQIKETLGISGILSNVHSWACKPFTDKDGISWKGGQIDLLIDRDDNVISLCEMKYVSGSFTITEDYEKHLRYRADLLRKVSKTRKALQHVFITTFGINQNKFSGIVQNEVTLEDLFR